MPAPVLNVLILYNEPSIIVGTIKDHLYAFGKYSRHNIVLVDSLAADKLIPDLSPFDAVVLHNSVHFTRRSHLSEAFCERMVCYKGVKVLFLQDEYRQINSTARQIRRLAISLVFSTVNREIAAEVYHHSWLKDVRFEFLLTGYVPPGLVEYQVPDFVDRPIDVSYRARKLSAWYGEFARQKWQIGERFRRDGELVDLKCDISCHDTDRIYGEDWLAFLANSRAVLGTEAGASFLDFTGLVQKQVTQFEQNNPQAGFHEIRQKFLQGRDGRTVIRVISPRCFEAAALRTLMIMYPGDYSGILQPHRHYVPLARDHSNMEEVVALLRDQQRAGEIIKYAYEEIACNPRYGYGAMVGQFEQALDEEYSKLPVPAGHDNRKAARAYLGRHYDAEQLSKQNIRLTRAIVYKHRLAQALQRLDRSLDLNLPEKIKSPLRKLSLKAKKILKRLLLQS